jgi:chaperone modulatory protein CbpM
MNPMSDIDARLTATVVLEEQVLFTLAVLCEASGAGPDQVLALVDEGLLLPAGQGPADWRFSGQALPQTLRALRLARDFDLHWSGVALVVGLLDEIDGLQARLLRS